MPFLLLAVVGGPLLGGIAVSDARFREVYDLERHVIALDNAAITLGRAERDLLRAVVTASQTLHSEDQGHHAAHACALAPVTGWVCAPTDRLWEQKLQLRQQSIYARALAQWTAAASAARAEAARSRVALGLQRPELPPLEAQPCAVCGLSIGWKVSERPESELSVRWRRRRFAVVVRSASEGYRIQEADSE